MQLNFLDFIAPLLFTCILGYAFFRKHEKILSVASKVERFSHLPSLQDGKDENSGKIFSAAPSYIGYFISVVVVYSLSVILFGGILLIFKTILIDLAHEANFFFQVLYMFFILFLGTLNRIFREYKKLALYKRILGKEIVVNDTISTISLSTALFPDTLVSEALTRLERSYLHLQSKDIDRIEFVNDGNSTNLPPEHLLYINFYTPHLPMPLTVWISPRFAKEKADILNKIQNAFAPKVSITPFSEARKHYRVA